MSKMLETLLMEDMSKEEKLRFYSRVSRNRKSKGTVLLLMLGAFIFLHGMHWYYLGKPVRATLYLFTLGFLGVGFLVDLFSVWGEVDSINSRMANALAREVKNLPSSPSIHG